MAMQLFCIPTEGDNDADNTTHEVRSTGTSYTPPVAPKPIDVTPIKQAPSSDLVYLPQFAHAVKLLRACERGTSGEPPKFTQVQAKDSAALAAEYAASRGRIYAWLVTKNDGDPSSVTAPSLEELDDQGLIDLAYATAGV